MRIRKQMAWIALVSVMLPGCQQRGDSAEHWEIERETIELNQQLKLAEYRAGKMKAGDPEELARLQVALRDMDESKQALLQGRATLGLEIKELERQIDEFEHARIQSRRASVAGRKFDTLTVKDGKTFENVSIVSVEDSGVAIRHKHGAARLRYDDLSAEQRESFGLDEESSVAAHDKEARDAVAYEQQIDQQLMVIKDKEERAAAEERRNEESRAARAMLARNTVSSAKSNPLAQPATPVGSRSWSGYSSYRSYRPTYRYVYYYPSTPNPFCSGSPLRSLNDSTSSQPRNPVRVVNPTPTP